MKSLTYFATIIFVLTISLPVLSQTEEEIYSEDPWATEDTVAAEEDMEMYAPVVEEEPVQKVKNSCTNRSELRNDAKMELRPFRYSSAKTTNVTFRRYPQIIEVVVPIYYDYQHKMIFSTAGVPQDVSIRVYDAPRKYKKRELLFEGYPDEDINIFEVPEGFGGWKVFVEYMIPANEEDDTEYVVRGCLVMMLGYLDPAFDTSEEGSTYTGDAE